MAASSSDIRYELGNTVPPRLGDSTAELKAARTTLSKLLKISDDVINLLLSADELEAQILSDIAEQLLKALKHICELLNKLQADTRHLIGEVICLDSTESITLMYKLHDRFFLKLGTGLDQHLVYSMLYILNVLMILTEGSKGACEYLVNSGSLYQNFFELEELKKTLSGDEFARKFIISNLMVLYNCSAESGFHRYFMRVDPVYFLSPFCNSPSFGIRIHSKFIAGRLVSHIPAMNLEIIKLEDSDIKILCEMLGQASASDKFEVHCLDCVFSATELVSGIRSVLHHNFNRKGMLCGGVLTGLVAILVGGSTLEKKEACLAIWDLVANARFIETLKSLELPLVDILMELKLNVGTELNLLLSGLVCSLPSNSTTDCPEACYKYGYYDQCIKQCDNILERITDHDDSKVQLAFLLRAKSLYHNYRKEQLRLAGSKMEEKDLRKLHSECYKKARDTIISLGKSNLDTEGSYMIDIAMMEYATETNGLKDISRCLLCQRSEKLVRSHMCPHSILKEFCAASTTPENLQVFDTSSSEIGHSKSPKQVTTYAFCKTCENVLSTYGEQEFLPHFFRKIYSINGSSVHETEIHIEYGPWLYHFCIGMLFRALIKSKISAFFNSDEVHAFLVNCRSIILNPSMQQKPSCALPHIFILIGPHRSSVQDQQYGFMNQILNDPYFSTIQRSSLLDGAIKPPYPAHYLLVHIGVINIIAIFSPSSSCTLPSECKVDPTHGVFRVPTEKDRGSYFTLGLWNFFRLYAMERSRLWLERPLVPLQRLQKQKMIKLSPHLESVFHIGSSVESDLKIFETNIIPSPDPNHPRIISLLPSGFHFRPCSNPSCIELPDNHHILFHFPEGDKEVYFLAVGHGGTFDIFAPYVIYSHCEPGLQFSSGFFVDPIHLTFKEFLPFREGRVLLERLAIFDKLKANIQVTLRKMLRCKGVTCLTDILQLCRFKENIKLQNVDLRCFGQEYCWYCVNRCSFCLQLAGSNYSELEDIGRTLRFCSQECSAKLKTTIPPCATLHQLSITQEEIKDIVALDISGSGKAPNSELVYHVSFSLYIGKDASSSSASNSVSDLNAFAFFRSRCLHLQTIFQLNVTVSDSHITLSPPSSLPQSMHEAISDLTTLLMHSLSVTSVKEDLSLEYLYSLLRDQDKVSKVCELDTIVVVKAPLPTLKIILILNDERKIIDPQFTLHSSKDDKKHQEMLCGDVNETQSLGFTLEIAEDGLSNLLRVLPSECTVCTEFLMSVYPLNFTEKCDQAYSLPVEIVEKICSIHFCQVNDILKQPLKKTNDMNESTYKDLYDHFSKAKMCIKYMPAFRLRKIGDCIGDRMQALTSTLCQLYDLLYCGLNVGLSAAASQCLLASMTAVASLCDCSFKLRNALLSTKIVDLLLRQLRELRLVLQLDQFIKELIVAVLKLCGSLTKESGHHWQFMDAEFPDIIMPYLCSSLANIALAAKVALAPLSLKLEDDAASLLKAPETIVSELISSLGVTVEILNLPLSQANILWFVKSLLCHDDSASSVISALPDLLDSISSVIQQGIDFQLEKRAAIDLLWKLVLIGHSSSIVCHPDLIAQLVSLTGLQENDTLQRMASCVLWKLNDGDEQDMPQFYIEECYSNGYYSECISECESLLKNFVHNEQSDKLRSKLMLIQGKALFHAYRSDQDKLRRQQLPEKLYHQRHSTCYSKTKTAILLLGSLLDKDLLDDEGSKILDLSMIDYIYETNDLNSCQRCLLCRKKNKLKRSHLWPRVLLEAFSSGVEMPTTRRVLLVSWQSQDRYWSPKEVTFFMFCASCEDLLSGHGETQFAPMFFHQIYDVSMTEKSQSASSIEYGKWLYEFCIGVVFRGIAQRYMLKFVNSEEIYEVLTICRDFLLQCAKSNAPIVREQDIFIMIGPTEAKGKAIESGFINRVLNMPALYGVEDIQLSNGLVAVPRAAHYFIAHLGLINILTKFKCSTYTFNGECKIDPNGGKFIVPENEHRKCVLPAGVWTLFLSLAQDFEVNWLTRSTKAVQQYVKPEKKEPNKTLEETFGFVGATQKDFEALQLQIRPPAPSNESKIVSFLPKQFKLHRSEQRSYLCLPKSHHVLLHYIIPLPQDVEETMFLCVGSDENYSSRKPYVIYHYFRKDGLQLSAAFFISPDDLSAQEFLPKTADMFEVDKIVPIAMFRAYVPKLLSSILMEKGFFSFNSLFLRIQNRVNVSNIDMKCRRPSCCWYCISRCELCMKETGLGCLRITTEAFPVSFCSNCQHLYTEKKTNLATKVRIVEIGDPILPVAVSPLSHSHKALLYIECEATTSKGAPVLMRMTLCSGKQSDDLPIELPYVVYHFWTLFQQQFLEFTVSETMIPYEPVSYTAEANTSEKAVMDLKDGPISNILNQAIQISGFDNVSALLSKAS